MELASTTTLLPLAICVGVPVLLGGIVGGACAEDIRTWYLTLNKPKWCPPAPIFGMVWPVLYVMIGYASFLVWQTTVTAARQHALKLHVVNLVLNLSWQLLFFKAKKLGLAQLDNVALLGVATCAMGAFYKVDHLAGNLMLPYVIWVAFANLLNLSIWRSNPKATVILEPLPDDTRTGLGGTSATASMQMPPRRGRSHSVVYSGGMMPPSYSTRRFQARTTRTFVPPRPTMLAPSHRGSAAPCASAAMKKNAAMA